MDRAIFIYFSFDEQIFVTYKASISNKIILCVKYVTIDVKWIKINFFKKIIARPYVSEDDEEEEEEEELQRAFSRQSEGKRNLERYK